MPTTPDDIQGGTTDADLLILRDSATDPANTGEIRRNGGDLKARDASGVFNLRAAGTSSYDLSGEISGTPIADSTVFIIKAARDFSIASSGHTADALTAPSASVVFTIYKNVTSIGTITYTSAGTAGTVAITSGPVSVSIGDKIKIVAPSNLYAIDTPFFTLLGNL